MYSMPSSASTSGVSKVSARPGPIQPRGAAPVASAMVSMVRRMTARSSGSRLMTRWMKPWASISQPDFVHSSTSIG